MILPQMNGQRLGTAAIPISRTLGYERTTECAAGSRPTQCWKSPGGGVIAFATPSPGLASRT
jgi:hypothetical protein